MQDNSAAYPELLPHLFRLEYTKMTAVLCRHFGLQHMEIAEDIASETFLKAMESWGINGVPENPAAWLYTVAKNKTKDYLRREQLFEKKIKGAIKTPGTQEAAAVGFTPQIIQDSQLAMIFAVCNPSNPPEAQICLALQILCGFSVAEIAAAFLAKTETIKKRLLRAREKLRQDQFQITVLQEKAIAERLPTVLRTIYLLFNEGYFSASGSQLIRKDLCSEALRLALILTDNKLTNTTETNALLALMCYQSSRLEARENEAGESILFEQQDRDLWSQELIDKGNQYLVNACTGDAVSKYHLEAGIAYWHTTSATKKWEHILQLYNQLILLEYSPMTALNRTFAYAQVYGNEQGIAEAEKLQLTANSSYHALLAYLWTTIDTEKAMGYYQQAIHLTTSATEKKTLQRALDKLSLK
ncbi:RNA polymerase sigma-70 factor (ECF subfamily) [Chitinophaga dinghuensis]|uniref:RNA polymerase sigma-70 factor (ECF subfamily) n=1 Tax=Chitinophaga dinghuensis TaxID=1539050 RepID=A0A327VTL5_9BACT|nr:sigma-70 family RNA polymerase sigma factor [Chitinophaga dinghuensis]RAJ77298.1 RNA polymerase sigma-70 factor (ECF subfamily) [Chitinophaga dinghuensis]